MKILFTGASSFTGYWFVRELVGRGHEVVATFQSNPEFYDGLRKARLDALVKDCQPVFDCSFGSDRFEELIASESRWDMLCHHAADVTNYKSPDFDVTGAVENNSRNLSATLSALDRRGCHRIALTGSIFECDEGTGSGSLEAFSPYGLSKALTAQVFRYHAAVAEFRLGKFVIPNPFGPFEEPRFSSYLVRSWFGGQTPAVNTPAYRRDNIHVSLLAAGYARFVEGLDDTPGMERLNPSGYVETQGAFAQRLAAEMRPRLDLPCEVELCEQTDFSEPRVRFNTDTLDPDTYEWDESEAWDELAGYYRETFA